MSKVTEYQLTHHNPELDEEPESTPDEIDGPDQGVVARAAVAAPSVQSGNPWLLRISPDHVDLLRDDDASPVLDPDGRQATLAGGAALFGVRLAVAVLGREPQVQLVPDPSARLATVETGRARGPTADEERLFEALPRRTPGRWPFVPREVPEHVVTELEVACRAEGVWVREIRRPDHRLLLADLSDQATDTLVRSENQQWFPSGPSSASPEDTALTQAGPGGTLPGMRGAYLLGADTGAADVHHDLLLAVGTRTDSAHDWLRAGQALHRLLLRATLRGLAASTLTHLVEVPAVRRELAHHLRLPDEPQFLVRLGYPATDAIHTPRRSVEDVMVA